MKKILFILIMFMTGNMFGQYQQDIAVNPNQSKTKQYIPVALGGKKLLSNEKLPASKYDYKGKFSSVPIQDFVDVLYASGTYTPVFSDSTNISSVAAEEDYLYQIVGDIIYIAGKVSIDAINDTTTTQCIMSLPNDLTLDAGTGTGWETNLATLGQGCKIKVDNDLMNIIFNPKAGSITTDREFFFTFIGKLQ